MKHTSVKTSCYALVAAAALVVIPVTFARADNDEPMSGFDGEFASIPLEGDEPRARPTVPERPSPATSQPSEDPATPSAVDPESESPGLTGDWAGYRTRLAARGLTISPTLTFDFGKNLRGGIDTSGSGFSYLAGLTLTYDLQQANLWNGGMLFASFQIQRGQSPSDEAGDYQGVSNIAADGRGQVSELWYQQSMLDQKLAIKVGKIDAGADFAYAEYAGTFTNGAMGFPFTNVLLPTYPDPSFGLEVLAYPCDHFFAGAGVFDGALGEGYSTGDDGLGTVFGRPADVYTIAEIGVTWTIADALPGRVRIGGWYHNGTFDRFDTGGTHHGASGGYVIVDQRLWRENAADAEDPQGVVAFAEFDGGDKRVLENTYHASAGLAWTGALPTRDADVTGIGVTWAHFNDDAGFVDDYEIALECFYQVQVTPFITVKPDLQYVINPGGAGADDALVALLRVDVAF